MILLLPTFLLIMSYTSRPTATAVAPRDVDCRTGPLMVPVFYSLPTAVAILNTVIAWSGWVSTMTTDMNELKEKLGAAELKFDEVDAYVEY